MDRKEMHQIIDMMIDEIGINDPASIAFALIQRHSEIEGGDNILMEAMALRDAFIKVQEAFEEEFNVLMGGQGNTYTAPE